MPAGQPCSDPTCIHHDACDAAHEYTLQDPAGRPAVVDSRYLVTFTVELTAADHPTTNRRWNNGPMPSDDARAALDKGVEAFRAAITENGLQIASVGYGVRAA